MRLQKYMAKCGVASRRKSEEIIRQGRVKINNKRVKELGKKVNKDKDIVKVDDKVITMEERKIYIMLNKPVGYVSTLDDEKNRRTVRDLIRGVEERIYPVGRLDLDSKGLILLTNDGDLTFKITHPSTELYKIYRVRIEGRLNAKKIEEFENGLYIDGDKEKTAPAKIRVIEENRRESLWEVAIYEGRNRQVRKMFSAIGHEVLELKRIRIGKLELGNLEEGKWRYLDSDEISYLKSIS